MCGYDREMPILNPGRKEMAEKFGMTHFVNPTEVEGDPVPYLVDLTKGGADYSFECIGNVDVMRTALECSPSGLRESIIIGVAPAGAEIGYPIRSSWSPGCTWKRTARRCARPY